jgi:hypothetical protein
MRSTSSSEISFWVRSYSFVERGDSCAAIAQIIADIMDPPNNLDTCPALLWFFEVDGLRSISHFLTPIADHDCVVGSPSHAPTPSLVLCAGVAHQ